MSRLVMNTMILRKDLSQQNTALFLLVGACLTSCAGELGEDDHSSDPSESQSGAGSFSGSGGGGGRGADFATGAGAALTTGGASVGGNTNPAAGGSGPTSSTGGQASEYTGVCKRGIPFDRWVDPQPTLADLDAITPSTFWFYNWTASPNPDLNYDSRNFEYVPMVWNGEFDTEEIINQIPASATHLLGFNEPMISGQGGVNMTLDQVLNRWPEVEKIAQAKGLKLISPAMTFSNIPGRENGPEFMEAFFNACPQCRIDAIAVHTYTCEAQWVRDHIEPYRKFGLPIWVTEFACMDSDKERVKRFMRETIDFFEKDPIIERYAWFMSRAGDVSLLNTSGQLSELGQIYVELPYNEQCLR